jgi:Fic family protein
MNTVKMNTVKSLLLSAALSLSSAAWAEGGGDRIQQQVQQHLKQAEVLLVETEKAPTEQRQEKMAEHMQMMDEMMTQMHADHPPKNASPEQHLAWMEGHDKLMGDLLEQMQREHKLMVNACHKN